MSAIGAHGGGNLQGKIVSAAERILGLLFPERCILCDRPGNLRHGICTFCRPKFVPIREPWCVKCGKMLEDADRLLCEDCGRIRHSFTSGMSLCVYNEPVRRSIYRLKYRNRQRYAIGYGDLMADYLGDRLKNLGAAALVPVPLHKKRFQVRGYNQAALIARQLGKRLDLPVEENLVLRSKNTGAMKLLSPIQRRKQMKNAFILGTDSVKLDAVILVDDIFTTGATIDEISRLLVSSGVSRVHFVTIASGES